MDWIGPHPAMRRGLETAARGAGRGRQDDEESYGLSEGPSCGGLGARGRRSKTPSERRPPSYPLPAPPAAPAASPVRHRSSEDKTGSICTLNKYFKLICLILLFIVPSSSHCGCVLRGIIRGLARRCSLAEPPIVAATQAAARGASRRAIRAA
eukprot:scaffold421_cov382-Prasinococcus_capsulatus_cf.AAC.10